MSDMELKSKDCTILAQEFEKFRELQEKTATRERLLTCATAALPTIAASLRVTLPAATSLSALVPPPWNVPVFTSTIIWPGVAACTAAVAGHLSVEKPVRAAAADLEATAKTTCPGTDLVTKPVGSIPEQERE